MLFASSVYARSSLLPHGRGSPLPHLSLLGLLLAHTLVEDLRILVLQSTLTIVKCMTEVIDLRQHLWMPLLGGASVRACGACAGDAEE